MANTAPQAGRSPVRRLLFWCNSGPAPAHGPATKCIGIDDRLPKSNHELVMATSSSTSDAARAYLRLFPDVYLRFHRRDEKHSEMSGASRGVLMHLAQSGPLTVGQCAEHLNRAQSVVSEIIDQLERHGLLARVRDESDRRRTLVWLTEQGRARIIEDQEVLSVDSLERAIAKMKPQERAMLLEGTRALIRAADEASMPSKQKTKPRRK